MIVNDQRFAQETGWTDMEDSKTSSTLDRPDMEDSKRSSTLDRPDMEDNKRSSTLDRPDMEDNKRSSTLDRPARCVALRLLRCPDPVCKGNMFYSAFLFQVH